jgi:hypothetical protein
MPSLDAVIGPIVEPQPISERVSNFCVGSAILLATCKNLEIVCEFEA